MTETVALSFRHADELEGVAKSLVHDLSAVAAVGRTLFCASDETATVERLILDPAGGVYGQHRNFALGRYFKLPDGPDGEMDIEGLAVADGMLWITGSQGLKRKKLKNNAEGFHALDNIRWDANRSFLGRIPLLETADGCFDFAEPGAPQAACMAMNPNGRTVLRKALGRDPVLKPYMDVPCKENGFDVEGIAVAGSDVLLGLRGPVIGGRSVIVETRMKTTKSGYLKPERLDGGARYRLHAVDLDGLGIRDLLIEGGRLLILAGPTLDHDGPQAIFALSPLPGGGDPDEIWTPARLLDLPDHPGADKAEGIAVVEIDGRRRLLVAYDSPAPHRVDDAQRRVTVDLFALPAA